MGKKIHHAYHKEQIVQYLRERDQKYQKKLKESTKGVINVFSLVYRNNENVNKTYEIGDISGITV